jgi:hypothetical protein
MSSAQVEQPQSGNRDRERGAEPLSSRQPAGIDLECLADQVYRLLLADLRLTRARGAPTLPRKKG